MNNAASANLHVMPHQRGMSLVEVMIAMVISLVVLTGIIELFMGSRDTYRLQSGMSRMQENARFASELLTREISTAGYDDDNYLPDVPFIAADTKDGGTNVSDSFTVSYLTDTDCQGATVAEAMHTFTYSVNAGGLSLQCSFDKGTPVTLIDGVDNMQVMYGEDVEVAGERDGVPDRYVNANDVADWSAIATVRVALLLNSVERVGDDVATGPFTLLDATPIDAPDDSRERRVFTKTVLLRNYQPF